MSFERKVTKEVFKGIHDDNHRGMTLLEMTQKYKLHVSTINLALKFRTVDQYLEYNRNRLSKRGKQKVVNTKMNEEKFATIKKVCELSKEATNKEIGKMFGFSRSTIELVKRHDNLEDYRNYLAEAKRKSALKLAGGGVTSIPLSDQPRVVDSTVEQLKVTNELLERIDSNLEAILNKKKGWL